MRSTFIEPTDWVLDIDTDRQTATWQQSQAASTPWSRWNTYLNRSCLETILPWLKAEYLLSAEAWLTTAQMSALWDVVSGFSILVASSSVRIVAIPTEAIDLLELAVPQEWVDIPSWAADYYLGVQIASEDGQLHIYGYATHQQLKTHASYDDRERAYRLARDWLNPDLNALWLTYNRYPTTATRAALAPIPPISLDRLDAIVDRLSTPSLMPPRLAVPFDRWAAIVSDPNTCQRLYQQRQNAGTSRIATRLSDWWQDRVDTVWQALDAVLVPAQMAIAVRSTDSTIPLDRDRYRAKVYPLGTGQIALVMGIDPVGDTESRISLQIHPAGGATQLPGTTRVRLLAADGSEIGQASANVTQTIQFQFRASAGEIFEVEIDCAGSIWTERFER